jgi:cbb3-type cytochrome oxidase maturation protein
MSVLFVMLPLAILIVAAAVGAYVWSARSGQFDDLDTPAVRMLHDDDTTVVRVAPPVKPSPTSGAS